jgi:hypothetical protein
MNTATRVALHLREGGECSLKAKKRQMEVSRDLRGGDDVVAAPFFFLGFLCC